MLCIALCLGFLSSLNAQQLLKPTPEIKFFDVFYGQDNLNVFNGVRFYDLYGSTPEHYRYFYSYKPDKGSVVYSGQTYTNLYMHYDLVDHNLIVFSNQKSSFFQVKLANANISEFTLYGHFFKKEDLSKNYSYSKNAFYEVPYSGRSLTFLVAQSKFPEPKRKNERIYYVFKTKDEFFIQRKGQYIRIDNARDLKNSFPDQKKEIAQFYRDYRKLRKTDYKKFMQNLTALLDRLATP